jgi:hypothetical protein
VFQHFEQHLNEGVVAGVGAKQDQPPDIGDLKDDGVEIDLPDLTSRDEIERMMTYLNNKAAGSNSIAAEMLVTLEPYANAVIQHYQAGFNSGKSTADQLFALHQILEKGHEYNILVLLDFSQVSIRLSTSCCSANSKMNKTMPQVQKCCWVLT